MSLLNTGSNPVGAAKIFFMTAKSIAATFKCWLKSRKEKVIVDNTMYYQIVPEDFSVKNNWREVNDFELAKVVGKDNMLINLGLKIQA